MQSLKSIFSSTLAFLLLGLTWGATPAAAVPWNPYVSYDYGCPNSGIGTYLSGEPDANSFPTCKTLPAASTPFDFGATINTRSLTLGTAVQCTDNTKPCVFSINLSLPGTVSLSGGTTSSAVVAIGTSSGVGSSGGTSWCDSAAGLGGTGLVVGLNLTNVQRQQCFVPLATGEWLAVRSTGGSPAITSAFDRKSQ